MKKLVNIVEKKANTTIETLEIYSRAQKQHRRGLEESSSRETLQQKELTTREVLKIKDIDQNTFAYKVDLENISYILEVIDYLLR